MILIALDDHHLSGRHRLPQLDGGLGLKRVIAIERGVMQRNSTQMHGHLGQVPCVADPVLDDSSVLAGGHVR